eukprot:4289995-Amphidinium_carterae.1
MCDTSGIEARHASVRRQIYARSVQTYSLAFKRVSSEWLLQCFRQALKKGCVADKKKRQRKVQRPDVCQPCTQMVFGEVKQVPKKKNARGGAWRGWVRAKAAAQTGLPDLRVLASEYNSAKQNNSVEYQAVLEQSSKALL